MTQMNNTTPPPLSAIHVEPKIPVQPISLPLTLTPQEEALAQAIAEIIKERASSLKNADENRNCTAC